MQAGADSGHTTDEAHDGVDAGEILHAGMRGTIAAMAMSGMRSFTVSVGLVEEVPPRALARRARHGLIRFVPKAQRRAALELLHWGYGAVGGAAFQALPKQVRMRAWGGPLYGLGLWLGFELAIAPAFGLEQAKKPRPVDRLGLAVDHLLYGLVVSETRRRPRE